MRVLLVSPLPPPNGGIATWTKKYLKYCKNYGIEADVINSALIGSRAVQIDTTRNIRDEVLRTQWILRNFRTKIKGDYDVVHINTSCGHFGLFRDLICCYIAKKARKKIIIHCHCNLEFQVTNKISQRAFASMINCCDKVLVLNHKSKEFADRYSSENVELLPNFIEGDYSKETFQVRDKIKKIIFVGHIQFLKGFREIYETAEYFSNIEFCLIGSVKDEVNSFKKLPNLTLKGEIDHNEVVRELLEADVFLFPSYTEGFAIALLEAMACGLPVIASDVGANRDMIESKGGIIVAPHNTEEIISAIKQLEDSESRQQMSNWNKTKVENAYTVSSVMNKINKIYLGCNIS